MKIFRYLIGLFFLSLLTGCASEVMEIGTKGEESFFSGNYDESIEYLQKLDPNNQYSGPIYTFLIGMSYYRKGDPYKAMHYFNNAIEICKKINCATWGTLPAWYYWLGRAYYDTKNYEKAIENISIAADISTENPQPPYDTSSWKNWFSLVPSKSVCLSWLGYAYYIKGEYQKAIDSLNKSLEFDPKGSADIFMTLAFSFGKLGNSKEALAAVNRAIELDPQNAVRYVALGQIQISFGQKTEAIKSFKKAIELAPNRPEPYQELAKIYLDYEKYEDAINVLKKALELDRDNSKTLMLLSTAYIYSGNFVESYNLLTKIIEKYTIYGIGITIKIDYDGYPVINDVFKSEPADKAGIKAEDKILEINNQSTKGWDINKVAQNITGQEGTSVKLKIKRENLNNPLEFIILREKIIPKALSPVFAMRAFAYRELGKKEEYLKDAEQAYSLNPNDSWAKSAYVLMLIDKGAYDDAIKILSTIKDSPFDRVLEGTAYAKAGDIKNAFRVYQELPEDYLITRSKFYQSYIAFLQNLLEPYKEQKLQVARDLEKKGQYKEAIREYAEYIKLANDKEAKEVRIHIAVLMIRYPHFFALTEEARKAAVKGDSYTSEGKFEEAIREYKKALRDSPFFPALYKALALNYAQLKQYKKAIRNMSIYLELYPGAPDERVAKDEIYRWELLMEKGE